MEPFNFKEKIHYSNFPELKNIIETVNTQREEGMPEEKILHDVLGFVMNLNSSNYNNRKHEANKKAQEAINFLTESHEWASLQNIARIAMAKSAEVFEKTIFDKGLKDIVDLFKLQEKILNCCVMDVKDIFNKEWLKENYPNLFKQLEKENDKK